MSALAFAESRFGAQAMLRLRAAFEQSRNPMLIADDHRRWVTGNTAACDLFGIPREEMPWRTIDEFTAPSERRTLAVQWKEFLNSGAAEGWYQLFAPERGALPVEFSVTANVLPARHLTVFIPHENESRQPPLELVPRWTPARDEASGRLPLTDREREILMLTASGFQTADMAERLFLSPETIKSHVQNAMSKLGAHTRAHAVAIGLVTGQISWSVPSDEPPSSG